MSSELLERRSATGPVATRVTAVAVLVLCAAGVLALHAAITTSAGRDLDRSLLAGVLQRFGGGGASARELLSATTNASVLLVLAGLVAVALLRRRPWSAAGAAVVVLGSSATTAGFKAVAGGTLPSGHVTAVAGLVGAATLVVGRWLRPLVLLAGSLAVLVQGTATMLAGWHRPSDVVAGVLVAAGWTALVLAVRPRGATIAG
jgi:membrane-associated phospholipid phosphatase